MTADGPIRRALARICSGDTMARLVDPILADIQWERGRPAWRGYRDLAAALLMHAVTAGPGALSAAWSDDRRAMPKAALLSIVVALMSAILLALPPLLQYDASMWPALLLLMPQVLMLTLPAALLAAMPIALRGVSLRAHVVRRTLALALCLMGFTLVVAWTFPTTNQAFRVLVAGRPLLPGPNELGFADLRGEIRLAREIGGTNATVRSLEHTYQNRVALICAPIPLALLALCLAASRVGRRWPIATGVLATILYFNALPAASVTGWWLLRGSNVPPIVIAWIPNALIALAALFFQKRLNAIPPNPWTTLPPPGSSNERTS